MSAYCSVPEVDSLGIKKDAYADKTPEQISEAVVSTSDYIDSFLASRYTMPITVWPDVIRKCCAALTGCDLVDTGGRDPDADDLIDKTRKYWNDWLKMVANGTVTPPGVVDSTPGGSGIAATSRVTSSESRGYSVRGTGREPGPFQVR